LTDGEVYYYKAVFTFSDGKMSETILAGAATKKANTQLNTNKAWEQGLKGTDSAEARLASYEIDKNVKHGGTASLHVKTGYNATEESAFDTGRRLTSTYIAKPYDLLGDAVAADSDGKKYGLFSCWVKTDEVGYYRVYLNNQMLGAKAMTAVGTTDNDEMYGIKGTTRSNDWTYFEGKISATDVTSSYAFNVMTYGSQIKNLWVDDVALYPCDANGIIPAGATNLLTDSKYDAGFETSATTLDGILDAAPAEVSATAGNGFVTLNWKDDLGGAGTNTAKEHKKIYFINEDGEYIYKGKAYKGRTSFTFENLENDVTYKIAVVNCGYFGGASPATIVEATTVAPEYEIGEFKLFSGATELDSAQAGTLTAKIDVENNKIAAGYAAVLIAAVYNADTSLKKVYIDAGSSDGKIAKGSKETLTIENIALGTGETLKTFLWNSLEGLLSLKPMKQW